MILKPLPRETSVMLLGTPDAPADPPGSSSSELADPALYINRELSWLEFNQRVLEEALEKGAPPLERLKFLAIVSSNLDEFFMVRVAGLRRQIRLDAVTLAADLMAPADQLKAIMTRCHQMVQDLYRCLRRSVLPALAEHGIRILPVEELNKEDARWANDYFHRQVFPVLTPLALDPAHPFPHLRNRSINLMVTLRKGRGHRTPLYFAVVQVPGVLPRILRLPGEGARFVLLEDLINHHISELFQGLSVVDCYAFRITRDSDLDFDEDEAEDLLEAIQEEVRRRDWGVTVRLEVSGTVGERAQQELLGALGITAAEVYCVDGPLNLPDFFAIQRLPEYPHLRDEPYVPPVPRRLQGKKDLFAEIRAGDILLHHPYESFSPVVEFLRQAAEDPDVLAIKMTLYRTSGNSPLVAALARAAQNRKQVTAVIELKARFDEENNIVWARSLERAGVHVVYGLVGLKTHCKLLMVVRREHGEDRLRRYVHLGTGNYNADTARLYTDLGILTSSLKVGQDVSRLFNVLTGFSEFPVWRRLAVAPVGLRARFLELIKREADHARAGRPAQIIAQMNSLTDPEILRALYQASQAGVNILLIIRGICCLRPGIPGVSERIEVLSIVGRFLEHCRIFYFRNGDKELCGPEAEVYLASADWMNRNLSRRVEIVFPVEDPELRRRVVEEILLVRARDTSAARRLNRDGSYTRVRAKRGERQDSQAWFMARALGENAPDAERPYGADLLLHDPGNARPPRPLEEDMLDEQFSSKSGLAGDGEPGQYTPPYADETVSLADDSWDDVGFASPPAELPSRTKP